MPEGGGGCWRTVDCDSITVGLVAMGPPRGRRLPSGKVHLIELSHFQVAKKSPPRGKGCPRGAEVAAHLASCNRWLLLAGKVRMRTFP